MQWLPASVATAYSKVGEIEQEIIQRTSDDRGPRPFRPEGAPVGNRSMPELLQQQRRMADYAIADPPCAAPDSLALQ
jgi:hypothetical protein